MSILTATCFLALSIASVLARADRGLGPIFLSDSAGGLIARRLIAPIVFVPWLLGFTLNALLDNNAVSLAAMSVGCAAVLCAVTAFAARELDRYDRRLRDANTALERALQKAETANKAKSRFLASVSHDLRTPLNAIIGFSEVMKDEVFGALENKRYSDYVRDIHRSGQFLLATVGSILDIARIEEQKHEINREFCDLSTLIADVCVQFGRVSETQDIVLRIRADPDLPLLFGDRTMLQRMLTNLLDNAFKFTPAGGAVSIEAGESAEGTLVVSIADTGSGIGDADIDRIRNAFELAHDSPMIANDNPGLGLGLTIVDRFAALHGASFTISSEVGVGTRATLEFPKPDVAPLRQVDRIAL